MAVLIGAVLVAMGVWVFQGFWSPLPTMELSGTYTADDGGIYYVQRSGDILWWAGMSFDRDTKLLHDEQWHRGLNFTNVFRGTINSYDTTAGEWADVPRGGSLNRGTLTIRVGLVGGEIYFTRVAETGNFGATTWYKIDPLDDTKFNGSTLDIISRFDAVRRNSNDGKTLLEDLKPYRDATVFYGHLVIQHLDYTHDNGLDYEVPHVNYGVDFSPTPIQSGRDSDGNVITYLNFGLADRDFPAFSCYDKSDADLDLRLKIDLDRLEPDFYTTGWGNRILGPRVFSLKLNDPTTQQNLTFEAGKAYMGAEAIMWGKPGVCLFPQTYGLASLMPGWADLFSASVLVNGRPINGKLPSPQPTDTCAFIQPCPQFDSLGIQIGNLSLVEGTYVRVTGALVVDCGHFDWGDLDYPCYDDHPDGDSGVQDDISSHQNQEIHPIYSIDVINHPYRPEDTDPGPMDLTGTYGGSDGSTYYVRQFDPTNVRPPGRAIWWLGLMRDRQPIQRGNHFPIIGSTQLKPKFDANDPPCVDNQCWAFANVFTGAITESLGQTIIEGEWAGTPQSTAKGSSGGHMKFSVLNHKVIIPMTPSIFPARIEKMYDSPGAPESGGLSKGTR